MSVPSQLPAQLPAHWDFITAAYAVSGVGLIVLVAGVFLALRHWSKRAREEEAR